jgi:hypothetical protein
MQAGEQERSFLCRNLGISEELQIASKKIGILGFVFQAAC